MTVRRSIVFLGISLMIAILVGCSSSTNTENLKGKEITVYYSPRCSCCGRYIDYLESNGMDVKPVITNTRELVRAEQRISREAASCHTGIIGNYFVEGHVPAQAISKLVEEQPNIAGITIPGMPKHAPGMGRPNGSTLRVQSVGPDGAIGGVFQKITY